MESEAIALREAIVQIRRWGYHGITFYGDAKEIYQRLSHQNPKESMQDWNHHELASYMKDICSLVEQRLCYRFRFIKRSENTEADCLAKHARSTLQNYVVSWI